MKINDKLLRTKSSISCKCTTNTNSTSTSAPTKLPLTQSIKTGSKLRLSNNRIYADEACTVSISGQIYVTAGVSSTSTGISLHILKNGAQTLRSLCSVPNNWRTINFAGGVLNLSAGDYIEIGFVSGDKTGITVASGETTFITLIEI